MESEWVKGVECVKSGCVRSGECVCALEVGGMYRDIHSLSCMIITHVPIIRYAVSHSLGFSLGYHHGNEILSRRVHYKGHRYNN